MTLDARGIAQAVLPYRARRLARSALYARRLGITRSWLASQRHRAARRRLGNAYGGWTIPAGELDESSVCYCVGCGEDITFDLALIRTFGCNVEGVDPTPDSIEFVRRATADEPRYRLHELALWREEGTMKFYAPKNAAHVSHSLVNLQGTGDYIEVPTCRLSSLMSRLDHARLDLLKLDIEGAACDVIDTMLEDGVRCEILCVEFDELLHPSPDRIRRVRRTLDSLDRSGYEMFWVEAANFTFRRT